MLKFNEFVFFVEKTIKGCLPKRFEAAEVSIKTVKKNNGKELQGIVVGNPSKKIVPCIYLDVFYQKYKDGANLDSVVREIANEVVHSAPDFAFASDVINEFQKFDWIKDKVIISVVNTEKNREMLENVPHTEVEDLSIIYKVLLSKSNNRTATITIKNEHLECWGDVTWRQLHEIAIANSKKLLPAKACPMIEILMEMMVKDGFEEFAKEMFSEIPEDNSMFVISNTNYSNGAAVIFYSDVLTEVSEKMGGDDLYILPSSVHEVIAISADMGTPEEFASFVHEVNGSKVEIEDQLSDSVYRFDSKTKEIKLVATVA